MICIRQFGMAKRTEKSGAAPARDRFEFRPRTDEIEAVSANLQKQITLIAATPALRLRQKIVGAATQDEVDHGAFRKLLGDGGSIVLIGSLRIESRCRRIGYFCIRDQAGGASSLVSEFDKGWKGFAFRVAANQSIVYLYSGGQSGSGCCLVRRRKIVGVVREQRHVRHQIEDERCIGAGCIDSSHSQPTGRQTFADEEDDSERLLDDPMLEIKNAAGRERDQAEQREQLVAPLHESRCRSASFVLSTKEALVRQADHRQNAPPWRNR